MAILPMPSVSQALKSADLDKTLRLLTILADADKFRRMVSELKAESEAAKREQEKALEYAGNAQALADAKAKLENATRVEAAAVAAKRDAEEKGSDLIVNAQEEAAHLLASAQQEVRQIRGNIDELLAEAQLKAEQASAEYARAENARVSAEQKQEEAARLQEQMAEKAAKMRELMS